MKIMELSLKILKFIYDKELKNKKASQKSILDNFTSITPGEYTMCLNYLTDEQLIDFRWMVGSVGGYQRCMILGITALGVRTIEKE